MSDFVVDFCWDVLEDSRLPLVVCTILVGVLTVYVGRKFYTRQQYKRKVQRKNEERQKALQDVLKSLDTDDKDVQDKRKDILTLTLPQLTQQLKDGQLSAVQVLQAYQEKAIAVHDDLNCVTEPIPDALGRAEELDRAGQRSGLLYGVPVSIKENIDIKGMANTLGLVKYLENYAEEDSVIVRVLKKQGAVPFVKTNVPQTLIDTGCSNPLFGTTLNPRDPTRSPGGSSGGEAALIGGGGSILGIGNDIGGSLRIPAHFCGICGFKPTANRLSKQGYFNCSPGQQGLTGTCGPMARDVDSLVLVMKALLVPDMFQLDPLVPPIPFRQEIYESKKPLKIGYILDWELKMATPALTRAVKVMKDALEKAGHELVPFQPPKSDNAFYDISPKCLLADGGKTIRDRMSGEIADPRLKAVMPYLTMSYFWRKVVGFLLKPISSRFARMQSHRLLRTIYDLWQRLVEREDYVREFLAAWEDAGIDVLLCHAYPIPAFKYKGAPALLELANYTSIFNLLNFPAGVVPVTKVTEEDDRLLDDYTGSDNDIFDRFVRKVTKGAVGMPVAVQCVALPWQEEACLRLMKEVETVCKIQL
ncbi:fatty-acid amide hydrolase 1-like isoform X1 [Branchiostoma floridae]|uniref:Fatty-acid amide hydrolase 1 n=1 Tax=Branchiostoma floridae TaxID=7739 RepID=A0A9J7MEM7_BRAFL|nr:fatty-acid amide hydrolase 1-like isoform X1 [Branchiostoma floridae]